MLVKVGHVPCGGLSSTLRRIAGHRVSKLKRQSLISREEVCGQSKNIGIGTYPGISRIPPTGFGEVAWGSVLSVDGLLQSTDCQSA